MRLSRTLNRFAIAYFAWLLCLSLCGCRCLPTQPSEAEVCDLAPRELQKVSLPEYVIEPPDILLIEAVNNFRHPNAELAPGDTLLVRVARTMPIDPLEDPVSRQFKQIDGPYRIQTNGRIDFGPEYGNVPVAGLTLDQARHAITNQLKRTLANPQVAVSLPQAQGKQYVAGEHLVRPDGTVSLGIYGNVYLAGLTLDSAKATLEQQLAEHIHNPEVNVDVLAYNSKVYYILTDGGGAGEQVFRFPCTGNETVLDAISQINGLPVVASKKDIWIARPAPPELGHDQVLKVDWDAIARGGHVATNYQVLPGDRIYVKADDLITFDTFVAKITAPFERIFGFVLLGNGTVRALQNGHRTGSTFGGSL